MSGWLLSREALIELLTGRADAATVIWARSKGSDALFVSSATWAEVRRMAEAQQSAQLRAAWLHRIDNDVPRQFGARLLPVDQAVLKAWTVLAAMPQLPEGDWDELFEVATAQTHSFIYVCRGSTAAVMAGCPTENPWMAFTVSEAFSPPTVHG